MGIQDFFIRKSIFCLSFNFLNIMLEIRLSLLNIFLNFYLFVYLVVYLVRFNTNNKHDFLTYMLIPVFNFTTNICVIIVLIQFITMFTEEDGININNEDRKDF